jgi:hypothetical protein
LFNETWRLTDLAERTRQDDDRMIHTAHASRYHWGHTPAGTSAHLARGDWDLAFAYEALARAHAVAGDAGQARAYTDKALDAPGTSPKPRSATCCSLTWRPFLASLGTGRRAGAPSAFIMAIKAVRSCAICRCHGPYRVRARARAPVALTWRGQNRSSAHREMNLAAVVSSRLMKPSSIRRLSPAASNSGAVSSV